MKLQKIAIVKSEDQSIIIISISCSCFYQLSSTGLGPSSTKSTKHSNMHNRSSAQFPVHPRRPAASINSPHTGFGFYIRRRRKDSILSNGNMKHQNYKRSKLTAIGILWMHRTMPEKSPPKTPFKHSLDMRQPGRPNSTPRPSTGALRNKISASRARNSKSIKPIPAERGKKMSSENVTRDILKCYLVRAIWSVAARLCTLYLLQGMCSQTLEIQHPRISFH